MNQLSLEFQNQPFCIIGAPCNQFGHQENGNGEEIMQILKHIRPGNGFEPNFPLLEKNDVNGYKAQPLYRYLRLKLPLAMDRDLESEVESTVPEEPTWSLLYSPVTPTDIQWNFEKFLIDRKGVPRFRFSPAKPNEELKEYIQLLLNEE